LAQEEQARQRLPPKVDLEELLLLRLVLLLAPQAAEVVEHITTAAHNKLARTAVLAAEVVVTIVVVLTVEGPEQRGRQYKDIMVETGHKAVPLLTIMEEAAVVLAQPEQTEAHHLRME
jgi:hypothetical protein